MNLFAPSHRISACVGVARGCRAGQGSCSASWGGWEPSPTGYLNSTDTNSPRFLSIYPPQGQPLPDLTLATAYEEGALSIADLERGRLRLPPLPVWLAEVSQAVSDGGRVPLQSPCFQPLCRRASLSLGWGDVFWSLPVKPKWLLGCENLLCGQDLAVIPRLLSFCMCWSWGQVQVCGGSNLPVRAGPGLSTPNHCSLLWPRSESDSRKRKWTSLCVWNGLFPERWDL